MLDAAETLVEKRTWLTSSWKKENIKKLKSENKKEKVKSAQHHKTSAWFHAGSLVMAGTIFLFRR